MDSYLIALIIIAALYGLSVITSLILLIDNRRLENKIKLLRTDFRKEGNNSDSNTSK